MECRGLALGSGFSASERERRRNPRWRHASDGGKNYLCFGRPIWKLLEEN